MISYGKGKGHPITGHEGPEGDQMYSSTLPSTSALDGGIGRSTPRPGRFTPWKETRYQLYGKLGGPQSRSERVRKISSLTGIQSPDRPARGHTKNTSEAAVHIYQTTRCHLRGDDDLHIHDHQKFINHQTNFLICKWTVFSKF
jgi:hypothetical protein